MMRPIFLIVVSMLALVALTKRVSMKNVIPIKNGATNVLQSKGADSLVQLTTDERPEEHERRLDSLDQELMELKTPGMQNEVAPGETQPEITYAAVVKGVKAKTKRGSRHDKVRKKWVKVDNGGQPPETVLVRFSVVSFAPRGSRLVEAGSCAELGDWDLESAPVLKGKLGHVNLLESEPDFYWRDVALPLNTFTQQPPVEYKFAEIDSQGNVVWEKMDAGRVLPSDGEKIDDVILLPVEKFKVPDDSEKNHTGRFYKGVKERGEISVRRVLSTLFVGSCPRTESHIDYLKGLGVTVVVNFQTEDDCRKKCVAGIGMEKDPMAISKLYEARGMQYVWLPTIDMSTAGRAIMLPHASYIFAGLIRRGHVVYSHCNAGVGRSVGAVTGYLTFVLGLSDTQMQHVVAMSRPVAHFDFKALRLARPHYDAMFGSSENASSDEANRAESLQLLRSKSFRLSL